MALSGRDVLVPVREVRMWLEWQTDATIMFHPRLAHAAICLDVAWQRQVGGRRARSVLSSRGLRHTWACGCWRLLRDSLMLPGCQCLRMCALRYCCR